MKTFIILAISLALTGFASSAQIRNAKTETVKIFGNCEQCESTIEKSGTKSKFYKTDWNVGTKMATITYDTKRSTVDEVLKQIALAGYDNDKYLAPDDAYNKLQGCCKYVRENKTTAKLPNNNTKTTDNVSANNNAAKNEVKQLQPVFDHYFALKDALVKTDGVLASASAAKMLTALNAVDMSKLAGEEHMVWMKQEKNLKFDAQHIKENKEPAHQREHFIALSKNMYELIKVSKPSETVYYQFCPMANDGKGANWLSKEMSIKNPYYGSQMLTCGSTVETIKQ